MASASRPLIDIVVGARPNYIKANPVYRSLEKTQAFDLRLVHTGQHYDHNLSALFFDELQMKAPDITLEVGSGSHARQTARVLERYEQVLLERPAGLVMVFGDVNSTIACTLAAVKLHIPAAHVEAGLRSFDWKMPEEINRILTDRLADLLFTTSREAGDHLQQEGIPPAHVHFVGNTMIDSLVAFREHFDRSRIRTRLHLDGAYGLLTFHRPSNVDQPAALTALVSALEQVAERLVLVFPVHPRTRQRLQDSGLAQRVESHPRLILCEPLGYLDFMHLQQHAAVVLTDSGGIQEESTFFGVPCLTVRDNTERPVTITHGTNTLLGTDYRRIPAAVEKALERDYSRHPVPELWDGQAAGRIADILAGLDLGGLFGSINK